FELEQRIVASDPLPYTLRPVIECSDGARACGELEGRGFGHGLALRGSTLIVGSTGTRGSMSMPSAPNAGPVPPAVYLFERNERGVYVERGRSDVRGYDGAPGQRAPVMQLAFSGDKLALGLPSEPFRAASQAGAVQFYALSGGMFSAQTKLHSLD